VLLDSHLHCKRKNSNSDPLCDLLKDTLNVFFIFMFQFITEHSKGSHWTIIKLNRKRNIFTVKKRIPRLNIAGGAEVSTKIEAKENSRIA
jgi:hypothetical protein